jgi:aspartyl-tRNA synthetase
MKRTYAKSVIEKAGQTVLIKGWVQTIRDQKNIKFLIIRDISGTIQTLILKENIEMWKLVDGLSLESVVEIEGEAKAEKQAPSRVEILINSIKILSLAPSEMPIPVVEKTESETEQQKRLDHRWIDLRKPKNALIFKVWTEMEQAFRNYFITEGFIEIHSPKITVCATESGAELFEIKYFDKKAYLVQSPQLYKQMAMASGLERVFEVGPVFRANPSFTSRHDTEFTMYDVEMSFIESHHELMDQEEKMIVAMFTAVKEKYGDEIKSLYGRELVVPTLPFPRITIKESKEILSKMGIPNDRGGDLSPEEERSLSAYSMEKFGHEFIFVHDFPADVRAFYSMRLESDPTISKSFDLLWNGLEITSGAQREHRPEQLEKQIKEKGLSVESFKDYLAFFKFGCPPHGGFAPGPTRMLMKIFNISNVREVTYLYRGINRLNP